VLPAVAAMLVVFAAVVLGGVYLMLVEFGDQLDRELDSEVQRVERQLERNFDGIQEEVRRELDRRLPEDSALAPVPTP
jgi:sensor domain CHASE-containing protein